MIKRVIALDLKYYLQMMKWYRNWKFKRWFITKFTPKEIAIASLESDESRMLYGHDVHQVELNIITDKLRRYLGESSKVYFSFSQLDINLQDGQRRTRLDDAARLIHAAVQTIEVNGLYEDYQMQLLQLNIKQTKSKIYTTALGAMGGAALSNAKEIGKFLLSLLHQLHK